MKSLFGSKYSLFSVVGNSSLTTWKCGGFSAAEAPEGPDYRGFPCNFPAEQGIQRRDEFARDCLHRHLVCFGRDFPRASRDGPRKSRDSAGFWAKTLARSQRRRSNEAPGLPGVPSHSLRPGSAVRMNGGRSRGPICITLALDCQGVGGTYRPEPTAVLSPKPTDADSPLVGGPLGSPGALARKAASTETLSSGGVFPARVWVQLGRIRYASLSPISRIPRVA